MTRIYEFDADVSADGDIETDGDYVESVGELLSEKFAGCEVRCELHVEVLSRKGSEE